MTTSFKSIQTKCHTSWTMINGNAVPVIKYFKEEVSEITINAKNTRNLSRRSIRHNTRIQLHDPPICIFQSRDPLGTNKNDGAGWRKLRAAICAIIFAVPRPLLQSPEGDYDGAISQSRGLEK